MAPLDSTETLLAKPTQPRGLSHSLSQRLARVRRRLPGELTPSELLYELLRAARMRRGLLGLCEGEELRVDYQRELRPRDLGDLSSLTGCMRDALQAHRPKVCLGTAITDPGGLYARRSSGAVLALPLICGGELIGVAALEDPARSLPPSPERVELLREHVVELVPRLVNCLRRRAGESCLNAEVCR